MVSYNRHLNVMFYCILDQLIMEGIIVEKLKNPLWGILSYLDNRVPTPNEQLFITFVLFPPYFFSYLSFLTFSYILLYYFYLDVAIFGNIMKFEFNSFSYGEYFKILVYYFIYVVFLYQTTTLNFLHCTVMFFNKICLLILHSM